MDASASQIQIEVSTARKVPPPRPHSSRIGKHSIPTGLPQLLPSRTLQREDTVIVLFDNYETAWAARKEVVVVDSQHNENVLGSLPRCLAPCDQLVEEVLD